MPVTFKNALKLIEIDENSPIGLHVKKKRLELKLRQEDAARIIGVCSDCLRYWETNPCIPQIQHAPKIIEFLGYNPYPFETETLGGKIKYYRLLKGLSHKKLGKILDVDPSTVGSWEKGDFIPDQLNRNLLEKILSK